jgi:zinc protease
MTYRKILLFIIILSLVGSAHAQKLPLDTAVRTGVLANGFTYYIRHNAEPTNRVIMYLVNKVGSVLEDEDQRGLAHFMEHMSFNGTAHFPHNELVNYLQKSGVRFGADINAYTSFDETVYELPLPSDKPDILNQGLLIMHDWAQSATLDSVEVDKERGVVLEEERLGKGAGERMQRITWPILLNNSRYATRIPIGLDTVLKGFKRPTIAQFYHDWYRPDLQALIIVGDINADSLEKVIRVGFGGLRNPKPERPRTKYTVPLDGKNRFVVATDREMTATEAQVIIKHRAPLLQTAADYRGTIVRGLFNQMLAGRYSELYRQAEPPFVQASAGISGFLGGLDSYQVSVSAKPGELEKGLKASWREIERVRRFGFTKAELDRAKAAFLNAMETSFEERGKTPSSAYVKAYQDYFLAGTATPGAETVYKLAQNNLPGISLADVDQLAREYITKGNRDILVMAPEKDKAGLPDEAIVNSWLREVESENLIPYKDEVGSGPLLTRQPVPGNIRSERKDSVLGVTTLTLSNGVKVLLKPTDFRNDEIVFSGFAPGGTSLYGDHDYKSAANAAGIIAAAGAGNYNSDELQKYLQGKQVSVRPFIAERYEGFSGASTPKDLETVLELLYAYFAEPRKDTTIFQGILERSKAGLANRSNDPNSVFSDTVSAVLGSYNVRRTGPSLEKLSQVSLDNAYRIYKERFSDAASFTFSFVGNIDTNGIRPLLEKYLGSLPATNKHEEARDLGIQIPPGKMEKTVYMGTEPKSTVLLVYSGEYEWSPENNIKMDALKEVLEIRLLERLREDESGVYTPSVFENTEKYPQARYSFVIQFGCAPQNVDKLITSALDEIGKLRQEGPLQGNLDKWRAEEKTGFGPELKTNGFWLNYLTVQLQNREDFREVNQHIDLIDKVSVTDVKEIAEKYLSDLNYIRFVLLPEKK